MKPSVFSVLFLASGVMGAVLYVRATCIADNCARAVTGTQRGSAFMTQARSDCSNFMGARTITPPASTVTATNTVTGTTTETLATVTVTALATKTTTASPITISVYSIVPTPSVIGRKRSAAPSVPAYASPCSGTARYSSACSCYGIRGGTVTGAAPTYTITVTATTNGVIITATSTITVTSTASTVAVLPTTTVAVAVCDPANNYGVKYQMPVQMNGPGQSGIINALDQYPSITTYAGCCAMCFNTPSCTTFYFNGTSCANTIITGASALITNQQCPYGIAIEKGDTGSSFGIGPCAVYGGPSYF